jgi:AhpD family alkylhydroperoxidase
MKLDDRTIELIAVGASVTAGCQHCLRHHADKARHLGAADEEIAEAIAAGRMVRGGSATLMDKFVEQLADGEPAHGSPEDPVEAGGKEGD